MRTAWMAAIVILAAMPAPSASATPDRAQTLRA